MTGIDPSPPLESLPFEALVERHAAILFDAYGVLVHAGGALPGAAEAVATLRRRGQPFLVVTNDASRSPERASQRFRRLGIPVLPEHVLSSGMQIAPALQARALTGGRVVVLGTGDSADFVRACGAQVVAPSLDHPADAVVIADEGFADPIGTLEQVLSMILRAHADGRTTALLLANPDLIYPAGDGTFGFTAGSLARMLEEALALLIGEHAPTFDVLGKPATGIFEAALAAVGTRDAVMLGDTLHTDVAGAQAVGMASAIVLTGVTTAAQATHARTHRPTYLLPSLVMDGAMTEAGHDTRVAS